MKYIWLIDCESCFGEYGHRVVGSDLESTMKTWWTTWVKKATELELLFVISGELDSFESLEEYYGVSICKLELGKSYYSEGGDDSEWTKSELETKDRLVKELTIEKQTERKVN